MAYHQQPQFQPAQDIVSGEQYRYALTNFVSGHDKLELTDGVANRPRKSRATTNPA